uniref:Uncharacterized protein n=1 Tax=Ananas comosus var. bracteatus TaxID=296719 RepID=A0A6V7QA13_ANACO|nr:unnamed protein product [Ananas comosus var. bracteatus]
MADNNAMNLRNRVVPRNSGSESPVFWRVVDSVPTYGSYPEIYGILSSAKATKEGSSGCSRVASAGLCTGTALMVAPVQKVYQYTLMIVPVQMWAFGAQSLGLEPSYRLDWKSSSFPLELEKDFHTREPSASAEAWDRNKSVA